MGMKKHGSTGTRLHAIWKGMKSRCYNPHRLLYPDYGGRGIVVCEEWKDSFETFQDWAYANGYREELSIDRIDNDGPYSPENCRWATAKEQSNNNRHNHVIVYDGESHTLKEWSEITGISYNTLKTRLRKGVNTENLLCPVEKRKIFAFGEEHTVGEWAKITGISKYTIKSRLRNGKKGEEAVKRGALA